MTRDAHVPVTREGAVGALKLLMIVLAASTFWNAGAALNQEFRAQSLVTATPFLRGASRLFIGTETTGRFEDRLEVFWSANHRAVALSAMLLATMLLVARYLVMGRMIDYLYLESEARDRRIYSGFVANIFVTLLHAGAVYGLIAVGDSAHAPMVPVTLMALLAINLLWVGGVLATAKPPERRPLRGLKYLMLTSGCALLLLFYLTWSMEAVRPPGGVTHNFKMFQLPWLVLPPPPANEGIQMYGSKMILLAAAVAILLCLADAWVQSAIYLPRKKPVKLPA